MPRRKVVTKREVLPDPKYHEQLVTKFINVIMKQGKKSLAESVFYKSLAQIEEKSGQDSLEVFKRAVNNVKPLLEVKSRRVGGSTYQIPVDIKADRQIALAARWIIANSRNRGESTMQERLAAELLDAANNRGTSVKKKEDTHKMAEANKAFAHYRW